MNPRPTPQSDDDGIPPLSEARLIQRAAEGDHGALGELLTNYQDQVYGICLRMVGNAADAADLTQDVLTRIMMNIARFDGRSAFGTWAYRIAVNTCLSALRRRKTASRAMRTVADGLETGNRGGTIAADSDSKELNGESGVEQDEQRERLLLGLQSIGEDARALLILRDVRDLDYNQISDVLEVPIGTVKSRLFRARLALREALQGPDSPREEEGNGSVAEEDRPPNVGSVLRS